MPLPDRQHTLIYGLHSVRQALRNRGRSASGCLYLGKARPGGKTGQLRQLAMQAGFRVQDADSQELDSLCDGGVHQGVALLLRQAPADGGKDQGLPELLAAAVGQPLLLLLDQVQDPRNLGACVRVADAAGAAGIIMPKRNSAPLSAVARKAASGAAEHLPLLRVPNLRQAMDSLRAAGVWLVGMDSSAEQSIYQLDLTVPLAVVVGAEGRGLRRLTRELCDHLARIPMSGNTGSLNLSAAAAVALFEAVRQRGATSHGAQ